MVGWDVGNIEGEVDRDGVNEGNVDGVTVGVKVSVGEIEGLWVAATE